MNSFITHSLSFLSITAINYLKKDLHKQLCNTILEFYANQEQNQIERNTSINSLITYFLSLISFTNKFYYKRMSSDIFNTRTDSDVSPFSKQALSHIYWVLYQSGTYQKRYFFSRIDAHFLILMNFSFWKNINISKFLIIAPIPTFWNLQSSVLWSPSTILYMQKKPQRYNSLKAKITDNPSYPLFCMHIFPSK